MQHSVNCSGSVDSNRPIPSRLRRNDLARAIRTLGGHMSKADLYTIQEVMEVLGGISRGTVYKLMREGVLASVLIGRRRLIPCRAI